MSEWSDIIYPGAVVSVSQHYKNPNMYTLKNDRPLFVQLGYNAISMQSSMTYQHGPYFQIF
jgi:hypothetical protein